MSFSPRAIPGAESGQGTIDYRLARQSVIDQYRRGRLAQHEVCDAHPELRLLGRSDMSHVAFCSDTIPIFRLADAINKRGWYVQVQLSYGSSPANIHLAINPANLKWIEPLLADIAACIDEVRDSKPGPLVGAVLSALASVDVSQMSDQTMRQMMQMVGVGGGATPHVGAEINEILDALDPRFRERLLTEFMNELFQ